jgi:Tfp pilus assembly protein PilE
VDVIQLIIVVMVVTITATITLAGASYFAFRMRDRRAPAADGMQAETPLFFERVQFVAARKVEKS